MPLVQISWRQGRSEEQKRRVIRRVTEALVEEGGARPERVTVVLYDVPPDSWATGGRTLAEEAQQESGQTGR
jgi:4-oxalocrotonate tautomerase